MYFFFFSSRRRHTRLTCDWSSDVCSSDLMLSDRLSFSVSRGSTRRSADAERGHGHRHDGETGVLQQLAEGEFEVVHDSSQSCDAITISIFSTFAGNSGCWDQARPLSYRPGSPVPSARSWNRLPQDCHKCSTTWETPSCLIRRFALRLVSPPG